MSRIAILLCSATLVAIGICDVKAQPLQTPLPANNRTVVPGPLTPTPWFSNQTVRQNLKLTEDQYNTLMRAYGNAWVSNQNGVSGLGNSMTANQQEQQLRILQGAFDRDFPANSNKAFADQVARSRYDQLHLQYLGYDALMDPAVEQKLNLTNDQRQQIEQRQQQWRKTMSDLKRTYATDRDAAVKQLNTQRANERQALNNILTPAQRATWNQMTGEPYDFPPSVYFTPDSNAAPKSP